MELKDTIELMTSEDSRDRLRAEHLQLQIRIAKLEKFLEENKGYEFYGLAFEQLVYMQAYLRVLDKRIDFMAFSRTGE